MRAMKRLAPTLLPLLLAGCAATSPGSAPAPPPADDDQRLAVGFLIVDGVYNTELTAPWDLFHHSVFHTQPGMRVFTVAPTLDPVVTFEGIRVLPDHDFASAPFVDVLVVPSAEHSMDSDLENEEMIEWVRRTGAAAQYVVSLCDGAFVLARAGLLDGRVSTTFPSDVARMRTMFPHLEVLEGVSFVHDGPTITSVGGAPSFEAALYLCELLYGAEVARGIAGGLVIDWDLASVDHEVVPR
jgi:transcriptional regulator GlxA family with amidase domain